MGKMGSKGWKNTGKVPGMMQIDAAKGCEGLIYQHRNHEQEEYRAGDQKF